MESIRESRQVVTAAEVDLFGQLKVASLLNHLQDAAAAHATQLGLGYRAMAQAGLFWVLSWLRLELTTLPVFGQPYILQTWPKCAFNNLISLRDFRLKAEDGTDLARASTGWMAVDSRSGRAVPLERLPVPIPYLSHLAALAVQPEKLLFQVDSPPLQRTVRYSDLDVNQHVNNARYVEFLMDCYDLAHHQAWRLHTLTINFLQESKSGATLNMAIDTNGSEHLIEFSIPPNTTVLRAKATWTRRSKGEGTLT